MYIKAICDESCSLLIFEAPFALLLRLSTDTLLQQLIYLLKIFTKSAEWQNLAWSKLNVSNHQYNIYHKHIKIKSIMLSCAHIKTK